MFRVTGSFSRTDRALRKMSSDIYGKLLDQYGQEGVNALSSATPMRTGLVASSWYYEVEKTRSSATIAWKNSDIENGFPVAIMLQYGHGTGTGGYVQGLNYINPALRPIFDRIAEDVWKVVTSA